MLLAATMRRWIIRRWSRKTGLMNKAAGCLQGQPAALIHALLNKLID
jgi:hypothetical protein